MCFTIPRRRWGQSLVHSLFWASLECELLKVAHKCVGMHMYVQHAHLPAYLPSLPHPPVVTQCKHMHVLAVPPCPLPFCISLPPAYPHTPCCCTVLAQPVYCLAHHPCSILHCYTHACWLMSTCPPCCLIACMAHATLYTTLYTPPMQVQLSACTGHNRSWNVAGCTGTQWIGREDANVT